MPPPQTFVLRLCVQAWSGATTDFSNGCEIVRASLGFRSCWVEPSEPSIGFAGSASWSRRLHAVGPFVRCCNASG